MFKIINYNKKEFRQWLKINVKKGELKRYGMKAILIDFICSKGYYKHDYITKIKSNRKKEMYL